MTDLPPTPKKSFCGVRANKIFGSVLLLLLYCLKDACKKKHSYFVFSRQGVWGGGDWAVKMCLKKTTLFLGDVEKLKNKSQIFGVYKTKSGGWGGGDLKTVPRRQNMSVLFSSIPNLTGNFKWHLSSLR